MIIVSLGSQHERSHIACGPSHEGPQWLHVLRTSLMRLCFYLLYTFLSVIIWKLRVITVTGVKLKSYTLQSQAVDIRNFKTFLAFIVHWSSLCLSWVHTNLCGRYYPLVYASCICLPWSAGRESEIGKSRKEQECDRLVERKHENEERVNRLHGPTEGHDVDCWNWW